MPELEYHQYCTLFPPMTTAEFAEFRRDVAANGRREPIYLYEGKILDGRHLYQACLMEGVEPAFEEYTGADPLAFALSRNLHRRHLTGADKRRLAGEILKMNPERSDRSIAREVQVSHHTVADVRAEVEEEPLANGQAAHSDVLPLEAKAPAAEPAPRVESTGKKARGRKPAPAAERKAKAAAKAQPPKPLTRERDEWAMATSKQFSADLDKGLETVAAIASDHAGRIEQKLSLVRRQEIVQRFAAALGVGIVLRGVL